MAYIMLVSILIGYKSDNKIKQRCVIIYNNKKFFGNHFKIIPKKL